LSLSAKVLGVVPHRGHGVAIEVGHDQTVGAKGTGAADRVVAGVEGEPICCTVIVGQLFRRVGMVLAFGVGLRAIQTERIDRVDAVDRVELRSGYASTGQVSGPSTWQASTAEAVNTGSPGGFCGYRVGAEIMVEGTVLAKDDHQDA
jgi:hypothetical protein